MLSKMKIHAKENLINSLGSNPRENMSARWEATWHQSNELVRRWISFTRFFYATNTDYLREEEFIQFRAIVEFNHKSSNVS